MNKCWSSNFINLLLLVLLPIYIIVHAKLLPAGISGAGIANHIHFHIVPRWNGDTNFMPVLGDVKVISQDLLETKKRLLDAYNELKG